MTRILAFLLLAAPAMADTAGPGEMPPWPLDCGPLDTLRITQPALPGITEAVLATPASHFTAPPVLLTSTTGRDTPIPAAVALPASIAGLLTALALIFTRKQTNA